jgi:hypothetical protein
VCVCVCACVCGCVRRLEGGRVQPLAVLVVHELQALGGAVRPEILLGEVQRICKQTNKQADKPSRLAF